MQTPQGELTLYQACASVDDVKTFTRECSALEEAMQTLGVKEGYIITRDKTEKIPVSAGVINCVTMLDLLLF